MIPALPTWDDLCGLVELRGIRTDIKHPFDSDANGVALDLVETTVFFFENPSDGYRSCAANPMFSTEPLYGFGGSPTYVRVPVLIKRWLKSDYGSAADGLEFIDTRNGKTILKVGTDNSDDYYPSFVCDWQPQNIAENETP